MGVDYDANFGIGVEINGDDFPNTYDNMEEYLEDILAGNDYVYTYYGDRAYSGYPNTYIIYLPNPFEDGYDLTKKVFDLENFLKAKDISFEKVDLVGGLYIW